jgi:hypothetical protein
MYKPPPAGCTNPALTAGSSQLTEVEEGRKLNLATSLVGLLQGELQGWPRGPVLKLLSAVEAGVSGLGRFPAGLKRRPRPAKGRQIG